jgi:hypothetical protein
MTGLQDGALIYSETKQAHCVVPSVCVTNPAYCGGSPILIPLHAMQVADDPTSTNNGNTVKLTDAAHGVVFDIFYNGSPVQVAWQADTGSAFLAIDRNGDGLITNAGELFGNHTLPGSDNGFVAIADLMMGPQKSGVYQIGDAGFDRLVLWTDRNHDGVGTPDELIPAQSVITAITTGAIAVGKRDRYGNLFATQGRVLYLGGGPDDWRPVYDVVLQTLPE